MPVSEVNAAQKSSPTQYVRKDVQPNNGMLSMDDFWKLLAAQLRYQDMSNPMSNSEMMGQLTQMATMSAMDGMSTIVNTAMSNMAQISLSSYATTLLGREITVAEVDKEGNLTGTTTGVVEGLSLTGSNPYIYINGKEYNLSQIMSMGKIPEKEEGGDETGKDEGTGEGDKTETKTRPLRSDRFFAGRGAVWRG